MTIEIHTDLKKFSEGKANKSTYGYYLFFIFLIFFSISFYAQRQYPSKFALFYTHISSQGSYVKNPDGALIWNIGMIIIGILYVPLFMYYYRCYSQNFPKYAHRGLVAGLCGSLSYIFVGLFPEEYDIFHEIPSTIAFFGHIFSAYFYYPALRTKLKQKLGIIRIYFIIMYPNYLYCNHN